MKLKALKINNFRQFYGEQTINFSTDKEKNITLIHAENGTGKTALLNAILWCFFEELTSNFKDPNMLQNKVAKSEGKQSFGVQIEFEDDNGGLFLAQRLERERNRVFRVFKFEDNSYNEIDNPTSFINSVIPRDMAKYFFFQGEGIGKMSGAKGEGGVKKAVKEILGFTIAELALEDIKKIKREYQSQLASSDKSGALQKHQSRREALEDRIDKLKAEVGNLESSIETYTEKLEAIDERLRTSDSAIIKLLHKTRQDHEANLKREEIRLKQSLLEKRQLITEYATTVFGYELSNTALDFIDEQEYKGTIPAPYNEQLVQDILSETKCICGADVSPGSEAFSRIQGMLKQASDPKLESRIRSARSQLTSMKNMSSRAKSKFNVTLMSISETETAIIKLKAAIEETSHKIKGAADIGEIEKIESERNRLNNNLSQEHRSIGAKKKELERDQIDLVQVNNEIHRLGAFSSDMVKYKSLLDYCENVEGALIDTLKAAEKDVEKRIITKVNKYLTQFVRQDYKAKLNPSTFDIRLHDSNDSRVAESDGQALLLNLTFIASLIELSRERKAARGQILTPGAIAPFVIDAPFGDLDNKYKGNVAKTIPSSVEQVVFLLSSSHWQGQVESSIRDKVGTEYNLVLEVPSSVQQKEEDYIVIKDRKYETVRYDQEIERTVIEEVGVYV